MSDESSSVVTEQSAPEESSEGASPASEGPITDPITALTNDLQRLQAEYQNYRKRVERDRALASELAIAAILMELLPVLDDLDRAREHGELEGGFKSVAEQIEKTVEKLGLVKFGEAGTPFDPQIHEALMHLTSLDVQEATATQILQPGYKLKERVLRPARVAVTDPE
ncbi:MAG: nucleotide exchange factor GrpE [Actinobacteria bacterium]|nr:nucleotide exchange factor GrpE [Actinomycetota bacterium]